MGCFTETLNDPIFLLFGGKKSIFLRNWKISSPSSTGRVGGRGLYIKWNGPVVCGLNLHKLPPVPGYFRFFSSCLTFLPFVFDNFSF